MSRSCRSRSPFGGCHLPQGHPRPFVPGGPDHAVSIGDRLMFGYFGGGRSATHAGYGVVRDGVWMPPWMARVLDEEQEA